MIDTLQPGQALRPGAMIVSPNGTYRFQLQADGNPVLTKNGVALWSPGMQGRGGALLEMQTDGNLVLYDANRFALWNTGTQGRPGSRLVVQNDGNLVVYERTTPYWETRTWGGVYHEDNSWLEDYAHDLGFAVSTVTSNAADGVAMVTNAVAEIPLVGPALHGVLLIASGPFTFTDQVVKGERLDRALINDLKDKIAGVREVAPYAQTVISFVPGIGQGAAAAIGAGLALAQGKSIDEAIVAGVRGSLPGGAAAQAALDLTYAAATGQNIVDAAGKTAVRTLGLPDQAAQAFNVVYRAAKGENIPLAVLDQARSYLPNDPNVRKAFDVGLALAHGKRLQDAAVQELANLAPAQIAQLQNAAAPLLQNAPALRMVKTVIADPNVQAGYQLGLGLMSHSEVGPVMIDAARSKLPPTTRQGFDLAVAAYKGATSRTKPPTAVAASPDALGAYVTVKGFEANPNPAAKAKFLAAIAKNPKAQAGAAYATREINAKRGFFSWLLHAVIG